jgi:hypothetical protein
VHGICALCIGIGLGLYGYESKVALVPMKWQLDSRVAHSIKQDAGEQPSENNKEPRGWFRNIKPVHDFWQKSRLERYTSQLDKYQRVMHNWNVRGNLQKKMDELMRNGVEPVPETWKNKEARPFVLTGLALVLAAFVIKLLLYLGVLNFRRDAVNKPVYSKYAKGQAQIKPKRHSDWNGILGDMCTLGLSTMGGLYLQPGIEEFLKGEDPSYPYPLLGAALFLGFVAIKLTLASSLLDINIWARKSGPLLSLARLGQFSRGYNWNDFTQQICSLILGVGLGFYAYESNLALLPLQWQSDRQVAKEISKESAPREQPSGWDKLFRVFQKDPKVKEFLALKKTQRVFEYSDQYQKVLERWGVRGKFRDKVEKFMREGIEPVPKAWKEPKNLPYLIAGLIVVLLSLLLKVMLYAHIIDISRLIKYHKLRARQKGKEQVEWNDILQEVTTIALTVMAGMYTNPCLDWLAGEEAVSYPYPRVGPLIILACLLLKFLLYVGLIRRSRKAAVSSSSPVVRKNTVRKK